MKHTFLVVLLPGLLASSAFCAMPEYEIEVKSNWQDLEKSPQKIKQFGGKWIWAGTFTFKKRSKEPIYLNSLDIQWNGQTIKNLTGTLFTKDPDKDLLPIEENLISDGKWNQKQQILHFTFNKKIKINTLQTFCLVLTIPKNLENTLQKGKFTLNKYSLPYQFKKVTQRKKLSFFARPSQKNKNLYN